MSNEIPRRVMLEKLTPEERAIFDLIGKIENLGAHPFLTDVVVLLNEARSKLADWVDQKRVKQMKQVDLPVASCLICGEEKELSVWVDPYITGGSFHGVCSQCRHAAQQARADGTANEDENDRTETYELGQDSGKSIFLTINFFERGT